MTFILLCLCLGIQAQRPNADSLRMVLDTVSNDSIRVSALLQLADEQQYNDLQEALTLAREAERISKEIGDKWAAAKATMLIGRNYLDLGASDRGAKLLYEAKALFEQLDDTLELARLMISIGTMQRLNQEYARALESYTSSEKLYEMLGRKKGMGIARHNSAIVHTDLGDLDRAMGIYRHNLSMDPPPAPNTIAATYNNLANLLAEQHDIDSALFYYGLAMEIKRKIGYKASMANTYNNLGSCYIEKGHFARAKLYLDSARVLAEESGDMGLVVENLQLESELSYGMGNHKAAYLAIVRRNELNDSIFDIERAEQITQLNTAYDAEAKQAEIDLLQKDKRVVDVEKTQLKWIAIVLTVAFALLALLLVVTVLRARERNRTSKELMAKTREIERQQEEILAQNQELSQQNHLLAELNSEKDGLIGIVAHDIRAPLNRSAALAELIAAVGPLNPEQQKFADMIGKVSEDGGRLIQDLLELNAYERKDARIDFNDTEVNGVLEHCANGFYSQASAKKLSLNLRPLPYPVHVKTDEKLLSRVLDNLVSNAIKFTHPGKNIYLSARVHEKQVLLEVKDEGQGISAEDRKKMFRKFQRLSARPTGGETSTGLGLSIVKTLVARLKGEIEVESEVGKGSTFTITLPLAEVSEPALVGNE